MTHDHQESAPDTTSAKPSLLRAYALAFLGLIIGLALAVILDAQRNDGFELSLNALAGTLVVSVPAIILGVSGAFRTAPGKSIAFLAALVAVVMLVQTILLK